MIQLKGLYYPQDECSDLTLAKAILVFDQLLVCGHTPEFRAHANDLRTAGYGIQLIDPANNQMAADLKALVDADLQNGTFRKTFYAYLHGDPAFLAHTVPDGNYGQYGTAENYRQKIRDVKIDDIPASLSEIGSYVPEDGGLPPELHIASVMAADSYAMNFSAYTAITDGAHLFGDSRALDALLKVKFAPRQDFMTVDRNILQTVAFVLLKSVIPDSALQSKSLADIMKFRQETTELRNKFKEYIELISIELTDLSGESKEKRLVELIYKQLLREVNSFQSQAAKHWNELFHDNVQPVQYNADDLVKQVSAILPLTVGPTFVASAARLGISAAPNLVGLLSNKPELNSISPYGYLLD